MAAKKALRKTTASQPPRENGVDEEELEETTDESPEDDAESDDEVTGDDEQGDENPPVENEPAAAVEEPLERILGAPRDGRTFRTGEQIVVKGVERGGFIVVQEPVYRASKTPTSSRWRFHLMFAKGAEIPKGRTKEVEDAPGTFKTDANSI